MGFGLIPREDWGALLPSLLAEVVFPRSPESRSRRSRALGSAAAGGRPPVVSELLTKREGFLSMWREAGCSPRPVLACWAVGVARKVAHLGPC